ncbi:hypothetical protein FHS43_004299 [Streptosporangium becharense]|uniref:DUF2178 domain-containing protein n=1 Tax=Streptosporangium becharense TaxID=1816182 RepID=A0A7W9MF58_9ACTN|nr:hypothetical protein [Streptosporangium becharense]MBB2913004.1 hypothetical protein [Streptosporangium becharense]MBB5818171.1 hypothetical protein [Streptosporangium becharense]
MPFEEKLAWIMAGVSTAAYATYLTLLLVRAGSTPLAEVPYVPAMLWTIGAAILAGIVLRVVAAAMAPQDAGQRDQRDREINRFGEHAGQSFVVVGGVVACVLAMARVDQFWIANVLYLAFVLSAILGSVAKIVAYRRGFWPW